MGAIAGIFHAATPKPVDPARVIRMIEAQAHRGPDGEGVWTAPGIGLGHRRLATVDLAGSPQPMRDGGLTVTFDGAIHNLGELRAELRNKGVRFHTRGDTELLLHGWRAWGAAMLDRLHGNFVFALHDAGAGTLFLARDRLGAKPLHYAELSDGALAFSSELKGLLAHPQLRRAPDLTAVEYYLAYGYVPDDSCIVAGSRKLPAGHCLLVERGRPVPAPRRWWDVDFSARAAGSADALAEQLIERMRAGVRRCMIANVPVGALLSGDVDAAAVVALMAEASPRAVATCAIGADAPTPARSIAARFATAHAERVADPDELSGVDSLVRHLDEPFADPSALTSLPLCALARERVTVALAGDGADEVMAGARRYKAHLAGERLRRLLSPDVCARLFGPLGAGWPEAAWAPPAFRLRSTFQALGTSGAEAYAHAVCVTPSALRTALFSPEARRALGGYRPEDRYVVAMTHAPARDPLDAAQYADLKIRLSGDILARADRIGMAVGLEIREPLLDHELVAFAATLPTAMRRRRGEGKWLMRRGLERHLPRDMLTSTPVVGESPVDAWFRAPLAGQGAALARSGLLVESGWFDLPRLARLAEDHRAGRADHGRTLWQLLMLEKSLARLFG
ncbi:asparagine synthase (glutamine-hydrolyzing) [Sphingomonas rubra]|uniref:asparagine synthase (glutamine-hydrolyzing) n=1 Tax=Sphingomonas rubra TaxID=634430 RepID=A0A1I5SVL1_9SPHN|nr:asparagine synthase (glutamine-hydrolyzing) [Sphingomonas rubra]SFP74780.1 asparagine synthase (glutamine-hydrolysing) [Sphingomonas rubra]